MKKGWDCDCKHFPRGGSLFLSWGRRPSGTAAKTPPDEPRQLCENIVNLSSQADRKGFELIMRNLPAGPASQLDKELEKAHLRQQVALALSVQERFGATSAANWRRKGHQRFVAEVHVYGEI